MAHSTDNIAVHGLSGKVGQFVFRQRHGKTVIAKAPCKYPPATVMQETKRNHFRMAIAYAKSLFTDSAVKLAYQARAGQGQTAHNVAIAEFLASVANDKTL